MLVSALLTVFSIALVPPRSTCLGRRAVTAAAGVTAATSVVRPLPGVAAGVPIFGSGSVADSLRGRQEDFEEVYERNPVDLQGLELPPGCTATTTDVALIFVGSGGPDRETSSMKAALERQNAQAGLTRTVAVVNWMQWFTYDTNRLSFVSRDIGRKLGKALATQAPNLRSLHVIGTSAGSFASDACCSAYVEACADRGVPRATVRLSLADPFSAKLGDDKNSGRGAQFFGRTADFAEHILNRDDPVPNTDVPLSYCYTYDVTASAERKTFPDPVKTGDGVQDFIFQSLKYHNWPLEWYARHSETLLDSQGRVRLPSHDDLPRGAVVRVA